MQQSLAPAVYRVLEKYKLHYNLALRYKSNQLTCSRAPRTPAVASVTPAEQDQVTHVVRASTPALAATLPYSADRSNPGVAGRSREFVVHRDQ